MKLVLTLLLFLLPSFAIASMEDAYKSTAKVWVYYTKTINEVKYTKAISGTATVFKKKDNKYFLLTAGHVTEKQEYIKVNNVEYLFDQSSIYIQFYHSGFASELMKCNLEIQNYKKNTTDDIAVLSMEEKWLKNYPPPFVMPLADKDYKLKSNDAVLSSGCAKSSWPTLFLGHIISIADHSVRFVPSPLSGRSGSAIFNKEGTKIIGVIIWKNHEGTNGAAVSIKNVHRQIKDLD